MVRSLSQFFFPEGFPEIVFNNLLPIPPLRVAWLPDDIFHALEVTTLRANLKTASQEYCFLEP